MEMVPVPQIVPASLLPQPRAALLTGSIIKCTGLVGASVADTPRPTSGATLAAAEVSATVKKGGAVCLRRDPEVDLAAALVPTALPTDSTDAAATVPPVPATLLSSVSCTPPPYSMCSTSSSPVSSASFASPAVSASCTSSRSSATAELKLQQHRGETNVHPTLPPSSGSWDWPLSRTEKKERVLSIDRRMLMEDRRMLMQEVEQLRYSAVVAHKRTKDHVGKVSSPAEKRHPTRMYTLKDGRVGWSGFGA